MGFFSSFKRNASNVGSAHQEQDDKYQRTVSLYPTRPQDATVSARTDLKKFGAKSFSYPRREQEDGGGLETIQAGRDLNHSLSSAPGRTAPMEYTKISQFKHLVEVYAGSISTVYKGICVATGLHVVVKVYHKSKMTAKQEHKLVREVDIQNRVKDCPFVCQLLATFSDTDKFYLVLENCEGGDLFKTMMKAGGKLAEQAVCVDIIVPLLRVLESLNTLNIIHRDIKPENIFLMADGTMKLGDFGLAIDSSVEIPFCRSGTLDYMAPEVLTNPCTRLEEKTATRDLLDVRNIVPYSSKVDVWAAGVLAYELVMGRPPFEVDNEAQTVAKILQSNDIEFGTKHSPEWAEFVRTALDKKPRRRPDATLLLEHPWIVKNMATLLAQGGRAAPKLERLIEPIPIYRIATPVDTIPEVSESGAASGASNAASQAGADSAASHMDTGATGAAERAAAASAAAALSRVKFEGSMTSQRDSATSTGTHMARDSLRDLRAEFGGNVDAPTGRVGGGGMGAGSMTLSKSMSAKSSLSFSVPQATYGTVSVQKLTPEEKGETGAAVGMKARLQLYMERQRL